MTPLISGLEVGKTDPWCSQSGEWAGGRKLLLELRRGFCGVGTVLFLGQRGGHTGVITCVSWLVLVPLHCEGLLAPLQARLYGQLTEHSVPLCPGESSNREQNYSAGEKLTQPLY